MKIIKNIAKDYIREVSILTNPQYQKFLEDNKDKNILITFFTKELLLDIKTGYLDKLLEIQIDYTLSSLYNHLTQELKDKDISFVNITIHEENIDFFNSYYETKNNQVANTILYLRKGKNEIYEESLYVPKEDFYSNIDNLYNVDIKKLIDEI